MPKKSGSVFFTTKSTKYTKKGLGSFVLFVSFVVEGF